MKENIKKALKEILEDLSRDSYNATILKLRIPNDNIPFYLEEITNQAYKEIKDLIGSIGG